MKFRAVHARNLTRVLTPCLLESLELVRAFQKNSDNKSTVIRIPEQIIDIDRLDDGRFDVKYNADH